MTTTRCAVSATTPRSCVMNTMAAPICSFNWSMRSRIWAWIVTSSAVVGSSAIRIDGLQASAMAIITRWRMPPESWWGYSLARRRGSGICTMSSISTARSAAARRPRPWCSSSDSAIWRPTRHDGIERGHRLLEDHGNPVAPDIPHPLLGRLQQVLAIEQDAPRLDFRGRHGQQPQHRHGRHALAAAGLADDGKRLAPVHPDRHAVHGPHDAVAGVEMRLEAVDLEDCAVRHRATSAGRCGGRASRAGRRPVCSPPAR